MKRDWCNPRKGSVIADMAYDACKVAYDPDHWDVLDLRNMMAMIIRGIRNEFRGGQ